LASIASLPFYLYPKIKSIQLCNYSETILLSNACLHLNTNSSGLLAHGGSKTLSTTWKFYFYPKSNEFLKNFVFLLIYFHKNI